MNKHAFIAPKGTSQIGSERPEVEHLCNRFGLSRETARNIVQSYSGNPARMEQEAERLSKYERLH